MTTPIQEAARRHKFIEQHWMRFDSLPDDVQERLVEMLLVSSGDGLEPISARVRLEHLASLSDEEIINSFRLWKETQDE